MKKETRAFIKKEDTLPQLVSSFYDVQHTRILLDNRFRATKQNILAEYVDDLQSVEDALVLVMRNEVKHYPIHEWIIAQKGLDYNLASQLIGTIRDIRRFDNISRLWAYFGLAVIKRCEECGKRWFLPAIRVEKAQHIAERLKFQWDKKIVKEGPKDFKAEAEAMLCQCEHPKIVDSTQKARKGALLDYNPRAKTLAYKIGVQFVKQGDFYRSLYDQYRKKEEARPEIQEEIKAKAGKMVKGKGAARKTSGTAKVHMRAQRKMVKAFLANLWVEWRTIEHLPVTMPYALDQMGHSHYIEPLR